MSNTSNAPSPARVPGHLAHETRLRARGRRARGVTDRRHLAAHREAEEDVARALGHLLGAGVVVPDADGLHVEPRVFADAARTVAAPRVKPDLSDATPEHAAVLRNFVGGDGRVATLSAREAKRRLVLEYVTARFDPKREYGEREVNAILEQVHDDYVTLRQYLVEEGLLERNAGAYRRPGTTTN